MRAVVVVALLAACSPSSAPRSAPASPDRRPDRSPSVDPPRASTPPDAAAPLLVVDAARPDAVSDAAIALADDATRCRRIRETIEGAPDLPALRAAFAAVDASVGIAPGDIGELGDDTSFCVLVEPAIPAGTCLRALSITNPVVTRAVNVKVRWTLLERMARRGKSPLLRGPRIGPAAVFPMVADPPKGKRERGSPDALPSFTFDRARDTLVELCFVTREVDR